MVTLHCVFYKLVGSWEILDDVCFWIIGNTNNLENNQMALSPRNFKESWDKEKKSYLVNVHG